MPASTSHRRLALFSIAVIVGACSDTTSEPGPPALEVRTSSRTDSARTPADSARTPRDSSRTNPAPADSAPRPSAPSPSPAVGDSTIRAVAVENFAFQYKDAAGVTRDSVGFRGVAGVTVTVFATTRPDSTSGVPPRETLVATLTSDVTGQVRTKALPDGWYTFRASGTVSGSPRTASASGQLERGIQRPSVVYLNLR